MKGDGGGCDPSEKIKLKGIKVAVSKIKMARVNLSFRPSFTYVNYTLNLK
jgi:hypothetical protein